MHAVRNINLCTKDCLCLYVCPTGATNTETGQIDANKCLEGCRLCVDACPSNAISMIPDAFPEQQFKTDDTKKIMGQLSKNKTVQENLAKQLALHTDSPITNQLMRAIEMSNRVIAEDILRESGFMLPQSSDVLKFLKDLLIKNLYTDLPKDAINQLIQIIESEKVT